MTLPTLVNPVLALKAALRDKLLGDPDLIALFGGPPRIFDQTPRGAPYPFIAFGTATASDNSTSSDRGHETRLDLLVFSREGSTREALQIAGLIEAALADADLSLTGHHLVSLLLVDVETALERDGETTRATLQFRAVTEALAG